MKKNDLITAVITATGSNGEGIVKIDDIVCFIPFACVGEKVVFKVLKVNKNIAFCKLVEVLTPAEFRVRPVCANYTKCGGCSLMHLKYSEQLKIKNSTVENCLKKIANITFKVNRTVKSQLETGYRNKMQLPVRFDGENVKIGFFAENSHRIVEVENCPIQNSICNKVISITKRFIKEFNISCYNESENIGILRHIVCRTVGENTLIVAVINGRILPCADKFIETLKSEIQNFSLFLNINNNNNNVILGDEFILLYGEKEYYGFDCGIKYPVNPASFIQVNDGVRSKLYSDVIKTLNADENSVVIDAYSGAGMMTAMIAKTAGKVYGIEIVKEAVEASNELIKINDLESKVINVCGACEEVLPNLCNDLEKESREFMLVLDPPRKGCHLNVLNAILKVKPKKIVYVSCSPQTLSRDLGILLGTLKYNEKGELVKSNAENGLYEIESVTPYDMFPQTKHVESVVCLTRK